LSFLFVIFLLGEALRIMSYCSIVYCSSRSKPQTQTKPFRIANLHLETN